MKEDLRVRTQVREGELTRIFRTSILFPFFFSLFRFHDDSV